MIGGGAGIFCGEKPGGNADERADEQGDEGELKGGWIVRQNDLRDRLLKAERFAEIAVGDAGEVMAILRGHREVEI